jgi:two-component sensor histidine kinase
MARPLAKTPFVLALPNGPYAPGRAREFIRGNSAFLTETSRDSAVLMVSELVTNAVLHGRQPIVLTVERVRTGVQVSVADDHPDGPVLRPPSCTAVAGRGLQVIDALASSWGVRRRPIGKSIWIRIADDEADPTSA